jgi:hypothetical protein
LTDLLASLRASDVAATRNQFIVGGVADGTGARVLHIIRLIVVTHSD